MPSSPSWIHIVPQQQASSANIPGRGAGSGKEEVAQQLLGAMRGVSRSTGKLPNLEQLPSTTFVENPENKAQGAIVFLHPHHPGRAVDYCFLEAHDHEAMSEIAAGYAAYATADYSPGKARLELLPLEIFRQIAGKLWGNADLRDQDHDLKALSSVSKTIRNRLLEVQKVSDIEKRFAAPPSRPAGSVSDGFAAIVEYALGDEPVNLVGEGLLTAFKQYVRAFVAMGLDEQRTCPIDTGAFVDNALRFIERMRSDHDAAKVLSIINQCPSPVFNALMLAFSSDEGRERAEKLISIVTKMKNTDAKADGIAAIGNMLRLSGSVYRQRIRYVAPLLELAEGLEGDSVALDRVALAFKNVRIHLANYCAIHYDASHARYVLFHHPDEDTEENRKTDLGTGRRLDAFIVRHGVELPQITGSFIASAITPLWQTAPPEPNEPIQ